MNFLAILIFFALPALGDPSAILKATTGEGMIYARSYKIVGKKIAYVECTDPKKKLVEKARYIIIESEELCTAVAAADQADFLSKLLKYANLDPNLVKVTVRVPHLGDHQEKFSKLKGPPGLYQIIDGNHFQVQMTFKPSPELSTSQDAVKYFGKAYPGISGAFVEVGTTPSGK